MAKKKKKKKGASNALPTRTVVKIERMIEKGGTLEAVAKACGVGVSTVGRIRQGKYRTPQADKPQRSKTERLFSRLQKDLARMTGRKFSRDEITAMALPLLADALADRITSAILSLDPNRVSHDD